jgi:hypothetical protein
MNGIVLQNPQGNNIAAINQLGAQTYSAVYPAMSGLPITNGIYTDGTSDSSARLQAIINAVGTRGGGKILLPSGTVLTNVLITSDSITIDGNGMSTIIRPFNQSSHCIQIGDGTRQVQGFNLSNLRISGYSLTADGDGLYINGLYYGEFTNLIVENCGRDGIHITAPDNYPTSKLLFSAVRNNNHGRYNLYVDYGNGTAANTWTSNISFVEYTSFTGVRAQKTLYLMSTTVTFLESHFDVGTGQGIVINGTDPRIYGAGTMIVDNGTRPLVSTDIIVETSNSSTSFFFPFYGVRFTSNCAIQYQGDGVVVPIREASFIAEKGRLYAPTITGTLQFTDFKNIDLTDSNIPKMWYDATSTILYEQNLNGRKRLVVPQFEIYQASANPQLTLTNGSNSFDAYLAASKTFYVGSSYNGSHFAFGSYHLWNDGAGNLRIKSSLPTFATDGLAINNKNNSSTSSQNVSATTRTYLVGSNLTFIPAQLKAGTKFRWTIALTKTAAGTATSTIDIAFGIAGTTDDTALVSFVKPGGTANTDAGRMVIDCILRYVGTGATSFVVGHMAFTHNGNTLGHMTIPVADVTVIASNVDISTATNIGICLTSGTSDAMTIEMVEAESWNL